MDDFFGLDNEDKCYEVKVMRPSDFSYENGKHKLTCIHLPNMSNDLSPKERLELISG